MRLHTPRRIAVGGILHETHTFAPQLTTLDAFRQQGVYEGHSLVEQLRGTHGSIGGILAGLEQAGYEPVPLLYAAAMPAGLVTREAYATLRQDLLRRLAEALPVNGVLLALHGAMVAEDVPDCEGDLLTQVRALVGPNIPVLSTLDLHGNLSPQMMAAADALVAYRTNPHLDATERGVECAQILRRVLEEGITLTGAFAKPPLLLSALTTWTASAPLLPVLQRAEEWRQHPRVVSLSVLGGFAYADTPFSGVSVAAFTAGDQALAQEIARDLADVAWAHREAAAYRGLPVDEAVQRAITAPRGPVVLADVGDNVGGGSPGDGTVLLEALLRADARDAVVVLADPQAVATAYEAGEGASVELAVGGHADTWHGSPVLLRATVERLTDGRYRVESPGHFTSLYGHEVQMGRCAVLRSGGVRVLLTERKTPPGDLAQLRSQGIEPMHQQVIVVKSAVAFRGAYAPIAAEMLEVDTPGLCASNLHPFHYRLLPRPVYPLDAGIEWGAGK